MTKEEILTLIGNDPWMMQVLRTAKTLHLPDWWIGAGFVRGKVWNHLHGYQTPTPLPDIDVIYFDPADFKTDEINSGSTKMEKEYEAELSALMPDINWSVTNQARMHVFHPGDAPYKDSTQALSRWIETATCIGVTLGKNGRLKLTAPHGIDDLVNLKLRPVAHTPLELFHTRVKDKNWLSLWPRLEIIS